MRYVSTRGEAPELGFEDVLLTGLARDGGLYVPAQWPELPTREIAALRGVSYEDVAYHVMHPFIGGAIPEAQLRGMIADAYRGFGHPAVAPLKQLDDNQWLLELFHGPTLAFKDFALQLLGNLYGYQCEVRRETINVLGATSGDTGAAAIHGLLGKPGTAIFVLYPDGRVSPLQERQMACTGAENVFALAVDGSFDDAQTALKEIFGDQIFRKHHRLSAVNSVNIARVLAQCVYYLWAWLRLPAGERGNVEFVVPTGNFGNVLAGWWLQQMGVPIAGFKVATNQNDILHRMFSTGEYRVGAVQPSAAPSMDIQVASNFERFIYASVGRDPARVREVMATFKATGAYRFEHFDRGIFSSSCCPDAEIPAIIARVLREDGYLVDPHTACGFKELNPDRVSVVLATASPAKFPETIQSAVGIEPKHPSLEALKSRPIKKHLIKATPAAITSFIERYAV